MGFFKKKTELSVDEILDALPTLSEDELTNLKSRLMGEAQKEEPKAPEESAAESSENSNDEGGNVNAQEEPKNATEGENKAENGTVEEPAPSASEDPSEDVANTAKDDATEAEVEAQEELENKQDAENANNARITALEARLDDLISRYETLVENLEKKSFGNYSPSAPSGDLEEGEMSAAERSYYRKTPRR